MEPTIGQISIWCISNPISGFLRCDGSIYNMYDSNNKQSIYYSLGSLLRNQYGGDGIKTFAVPDLRGRIMLGGYPDGASTGSETVSLDANTMPAHTHKVSTGVVQAAGLVPAIQGSGYLTATTAAATTPTPGGNNIFATAPDYGVIGEAQNIYAAKDDSTYINLAGSAIQAGQNIKLGNLKYTGSVNLSFFGSGHTHENRQPFLGLNFFICYQGYYPQPPQETTNISNQIK